VNSFKFPNKFKWVKCGEDACAMMTADQKGLTAIMNFRNREPLVVQYGLLQARRWSGNRFLWGCGGCRSCRGGRGLCNHHLELVRVGVVNLRML
jgi:hypothetical protein